MVDILCWVSVGSKIGAPIWFIGFRFEKSTQNTWRKIIWKPTCTVDSGGSMLLCSCFSTGAEQTPPVFAGATFGSLHGACQDPPWIRCGVGGLNSSGGWVETAQDGAQKYWPLIRKDNCSIPRWHGCYRIGEVHLVVLFWEENGGMLFRVQSDGLLSLVVLQVLSEPDLRKEFYQHEVPTASLTLNLRQVLRKLPKDKIWYFLGFPGPSYHIFNSTAIFEMNNSGYLLSSIWCPMFAPPGHQWSLAVPPGLDEVDAAGTFWTKVEVCQLLSRMKNTWWLVKILIWYIWRWHWWTCFIPLSASKAWLGWSDWAAQKGPQAYVRVLWDV